jgi:hypothetical protein
MNRYLQHLRNVIENNISVHMIYNGIYFPQCKLVFAAGPEIGFGLIVSGGVFTAGEGVSVGYVSSPYAYTFESNIVGVQTGGTEDVLLHISPPTKIARLERRKWDRARPSEENPVAVSLPMPVGQTMEVHALELSLNGIGFSLPFSAENLDVGSRLTMTMGFPKFGNMKMAGVVRTVTEVTGAMRYGVEFDPLPEFDSLLAQYLYLRKVEIRVGNRSGGRLRKESILVMMKDTGLGKYAFSCPQSPVKRVDDFNSFSEIVSVDVIDFLEDESLPDPGTVPR